MQKLLFLNFLIIALIFSACKSKEKEVETVEEMPTVITEPVYLTKAEFSTRIHNFEESHNKWIFLGERPCVINFTAGWCPPCKELTPFYAEMAEKYAGKIDFYKIDIDEEKDFGIFRSRGIPLILFCSMNSDTVSQLGWAMEGFGDVKESKAEFIRNVEELLK